MKSGDFFLALDDLNVLKEQMQDYPWLTIPSPKTLE